MPDYMFLLESRLSPEQRAVMLRVQELSAAMGFNLYLTGGTVRDLITGASLRDLDFTVEGNPSKVARELEKGGAKTTKQGGFMEIGVSVLPMDAAVEATSAERAWSAEMASSNRRRWPIDLTPSSRRSSPVSRRKISRSMSLSRNAGAYCSSPRTRSHSATSIGVAQKRQASGVH